MRKKGKIKNAQVHDYSIENGRLKTSIAMGATEKSVIVGNSLDDDRWHSVDFARKGMIISIAVDDEKPLIG